MTISTERISAALTAASLLVEVRGALPDRLTDIAEDSRRVKPGGLFVAVRGSVQDGHVYLDRARDAGAVAAIVEDPTRTTLPALVVKNARRAAAVAAAAAFDHPNRLARLVGVTGTNGKSTTVHLIRHLLDAPGAPSASIGTVGILKGSAGVPLEDVGLTTPGPVELQRLLRDLVDDGVRSVAMEVSSHALDQHRVEGLAFEAAVYTNLTRDHLDYHKTMDAYREAKVRLSEHLAPHGVMVVNADDPAWSVLPSGRRRLSYSARVSSAEVHASDIAYAPTGSRWTLGVAEERAEVRLPLIGDFNVSNALGAAAAAYALGLPIGRIAERLATVPQVPGRLEVIHRDPTVLRDYAHTPDALERALLAVRPFTRGRLIALFGCGGDRDRGKRPEMGGIAERLADHVIITSDNPRTEDPERILDEIEAGMRGRNHERIEDRRQAISHALDIASAEDVVVLAGKGHETYQIRGTEKLPFDEQAIVAELAAARA